MQQHLGRPETAAQNATAGGELAAVDAEPQRYGKTTTSACPDGVDGERGEEECGCVLLVPIDFVCGTETAGPAQLFV